MTNRDVIMKFRVTEMERQIIKNKAKEAGLSVSELIRRSAFNLKLRSRLTEQEIKCYKTLTKFSLNFKNISNLFKRGDITGVKEEAIRTSELIRQHLNKLK